MVMSASAEEPLYTLLLLLLFCCFPINWHNQVHSRSQDRPPSLWMEACPKEEKKETKSVHVYIKTDASHTSAKVIYNERGRAGHWLTQSVSTTVVKIDQYTGLQQYTGRA